MVHFVLINERNRQRYLRLIEPVGVFFARMGLHPNVLTLAGLVLSAVAGLVYAAGAFFWGAWVVVVAGICDTLDGLIARQTKKDSTFGAFFDSTLDRYSDMFLFAGLGYYFAGGKSLPVFPASSNTGEAHPWTVLIIFLAMTGSFLVSYTRARAEGLGVECRGGMMQRPERMVLLIIGCLLGAIPVVGPLFLKCTLVILAVSTHLTAIHRIIRVRGRILKENR
ncbi:MAG: CDP-alcohol phosphatidyltransferase family protein [Desulfatiglandales bacterium]